MVRIISYSQNAEVRAFVEAYEIAWRTSPFPNLKEFLPPQNHPAHDPTLCEMVCIEIEHRLKKSHDEFLSQLRHCYPELSGNPTFWAEVVRHEYRVRWDAGNRVEPESYLLQYGVDVSENVALDGSSHWSVDLWSRLSSPTQNETGIVQATLEVANGLGRLLPEELRDEKASDWESWVQSFRGTPDEVALFADLLQSKPESAARIIKAASQMPVAGTDFVGFQLIRELGRGAFSHVFLARQSELADRFVVLKVATDHFGESQTLAQLQHTNIVPIYSQHAAGDLQAVCMPYLGETTFGDVLSTVRSSAQFPRSGRNLLSTRRAPTTLPDGPTEIPSDGPVNDQSSTPKLSLRAPETTDHEVKAVSARGILAKPAQLWIDRLSNMTYVDAVLTLISRLADGLAHAHARGILHRDLKPANILLTDDAEPMLLDFNLSEDTKKISGAELAGIGGTLPYMAPEHLLAFSGEKLVVDARADLYSLGVILYELLSSHHPFPLRRGSTRELLIQMVMDRSQAPDLRRHNPDVTLTVEALVQKCLAPIPEDRYQTAEQLRDDIRRHLEHLPLKHAPNRSLYERFGKWRKRNPRTLPIAGLIFTICLLTGSVALLTRERERRHAEESFRIQRETLDELEQFEDQSFEINHQLNSLPVSGAALLEGMEYCQRVLLQYGFWDELGGKASLRAVQLAENDRERFNVTAGQYILIYVQSLLVQIEQGGKNETREVLRKALQLNESAERCFKTSKIPRQLWSQRAEIFTGLGVSKLAEESHARAHATQICDSWDRYTLARTLIIRGQMPEAIALLRQATRENPKHFWSWFLLGHCHFHGGNSAEAIRCFSCSLTLKSDFAGPYLERGLAYLAEKKFAEAKSDFTRVIELKPELADGYLDRALAHEGLGDIDDAIGDLSKVLEIGKRHARAYFIRARLLEKQGDRAGATRDRVEGLKREPTDAESWIARGLYRAQIGDSEGAIADYRKALELDSRSLAALQNSAVVYTDQLKKPSEAVACLNNALKIDPDYLPALQGRAVLLARIGKCEEAHADIERLLKRDSSPTSRYYAACVFALTSLKKDSDRTKAFEHLRSALRGGFGPDFFDSDDDLKPIREIKEFHHLLTAIRVLWPKNPAPK